MLISRGDVYWVNLSKVFSELDTHAQKGIRPCVIISNNRNNRYNSRVNIVPLTTQKDYLPQHIMVMLHNVKNYVISESMCSIPKELLLDKYGWLSKKAMHYVEKAVKIQLGIWKGDYNERY